MTAQPTTQEHDNESELCSLKVHLTISEHISASHTMHSTLLRAVFQASVCIREFPGMCAAILPCHLQCTLFELSLPAWLKRTNVAHLNQHR